MSFRETTATLNFYIENRVDFSTVWKVKLSGHRRTWRRALTRATHADAQAMEDLFVRANSPSGNEGNGANERDSCE